MNHKQKEQLFTENKEQIQIQETKKYPCNICEKTFMSSENLEKHISMVHKKEKDEPITDTTKEPETTVLLCNICNYRTK